MRKLGLVLAALLVLACWSAAWADNAPKGEFGRDVSHLRGEAGVGKVKLSWELADKSGVDRIEIYKLNESTDVLEKIATVDKAANQAEISLPPLMLASLVVKVVSSKGEMSKGQKIDVIPLHKNVVLDQVEGRKLYIYLPDGYGQEKDKRYPVVYMHDGQNIFENMPDAGSVNTWQVESMLNRLIAEGKLPKMIVVGISNSYDRNNEYLPYLIEAYGGGGAGEFSEFIVHKIIPYIDRSYRTLADRENRAVMGSSNGGSLALWMCYRYPETFSMVGAVSPAFYNHEIPKEILRDKTKSPNLKIWLDIGEGEGPMVGETRKTVDILLQRGYTYGKNLLYYEAKGAEHNEASWAERVAYPFIFFKGKEGGKVTAFDVSLTETVGVLSGYGPGCNYNYVNPVVELDNGLRFSLYNQAKYALTDTKNAWIDGAGGLHLDKPDKLKVKVSYQNQEKTAEFEAKAE